MKTLRLVVFAVSLILLCTPVLQAGETADTLTMDQMKQKAEAMVEDMGAIRDNAEAKLRKARADKDMATLDAVNEALIALKGVLKLAEDYLYDLQADYKANNEKAVESSYKKILIAMKKIADLDARVRSSGGPTEAGVTEGEPVIERSIDPDLPSQDPLENLEGDPVFTEKPPGSSPWE